MGIKPNTKTLIVIAGPTAVGKTYAAIKLAERFKAEIISADSRQFYREMSIGTAKPTPEELAKAPHHFINSHSITESFSVGDFEKQGLSLLSNLFKSNPFAILVGGSGLFIKAICEGFDDLPTASEGIRDRLNSEYNLGGISFLQDKLKAVDPVYYNQVDLNNPQRIIRALEVAESSGIPFSYYRKATLNSRPFKIVKLALELPREILYDRINARVDNMVNQGLIDEVRSLLPYRNLNALNTVGYAEVFDYLDGLTTLNKAVEKIKQNTRNFAKRQLTWFRKDKEFTWLNAAENDFAIVDLDIPS